MNPACFNPWDVIRNPFTIIFFLFFCIPRLFFNLSDRFNSVLYAEFYIIVDMYIVYRREQLKNVCFKN